MYIVTSQERNMVICRFSHHLFPQFFGLSSLDGGESIVCVHIGIGNMGGENALISSSFEKALQAFWQDIMVIMA